jgi:hypothetical protein
MSEEWTSVNDGTVAADPEVKIVFEEIGDVFVGEFLGYRHLTDRETSQNYTQARFRDPDTQEICYTRANHSMREGLDRVPIGSMTRIAYVDDVDTGMPSPMRAFSVDMKGKPAATASAAAANPSRPVRRAARPQATNKPKGNAAS